MADPAEQPVAPANEIPAPGHQEQPDEQEETGGYPTTPGIRWVPLYPLSENRADSLALGEARRGFTHGLIGAGIVLLATVVLAMVYRDASAIGTLIGVGGAVAAGVFMVAAGMGLLAGEALQAVEVETPEPDPFVSQGRFAGLAGGGWAAPITAAREGLQGLTTARAAVFAGALLLAIAAVGGGVSTAGSGGRDGDTAPSTTAPATSTSPGPTDTP